MLYPLTALCTGAELARPDAGTAVRLMMCEVREATAKILDSTTLADLLKRAQVALHGHDALDFSI